MKQTSLSYRADIDGLRAIAVLSVLLFHFGVPGLHGGFAGVDIFFVISGFLITQQLVADISEQRLGSLLVGFYSRRIRRILPALLTVLVATLGVGWIALVPLDYKTLGTSVAFSALGAASIFFYWSTGYFDRAAEFQPLLHMWSLGVEEQFYLVWPLMLHLMTRTGRNRAFGLTAGLLIFGFALAVWTVSVNPKGAFYLPMPRARELASGALVALLPKMQSRVLSVLMGVIGLGLIGAGLALLSGAEGSLGFSMLPVVLGASLLVAPRSETIVPRILSVPPIRCVGALIPKNWTVHNWSFPLLP